MKNGKNTCRKLSCRLFSNSTQIVPGFRVLSCKMLFRGIVGCANNLLELLDPHRQAISTIWRGEAGEGGSSNKYKHHLLLRAQQSIHSACGRKRVVKIYAPIVNRSTLCIRLLGVFVSITTAYIIRGIGSWGQSDGGPWRGQQFGLTRCLLQLLQSHKWWLVRSLVIKAVIETSELFVAFCVDITYVLNNIINLFFSST